MSPIAPFLQQAMVDFGSGLARAGGTPRNRPPTLCCFDARRDQILDDVAKKYPQTYFSGMVALARIIRWDPANTSVFAAQKRLWPS